MHTHTSCDKQNIATVLIRKPIEHSVSFAYYFYKTADTFKHIGDSFTLHSHFGYRKVSVANCIWQCIMHMKMMNHMFWSQWSEWYSCWERGVKYLLSSVDYSSILHTTALSTCTHGDIRLVGGVSTNEGLVEICFSGIWVLVCDRNWNVNGSTVVCRQLTGEPTPSKRLLLYINWGISTWLVKLPGCTNTNA